MCREFGHVNSKIQKVWENRTTITSALEHSASRIKGFRNPERSDLNWALLKVVYAREKLHSTSERLSSHDNFHHHHQPSRVRPRQTCIGRVYYRLHRSSESSSSISSIIHHYFSHPVFILSFYMSQPTGFVFFQFNVKWFYFHFFQNSFFLFVFKKDVPAVILGNFILNDVSFFYPFFYGSKFRYHT